MRSAQKQIGLASPARIVKRKVARPCALFAAFLLLVSAPMQAADPFDTGDYARVLADYVQPDGKVRYAALKENPADLERFLARLAAASPASRPELFPTRADQMAYWINAYNAFVLQGVLERYPIDSVISLRTAYGALFFKRARYVAGGKKYSLDDIEHGILRKRYGDPRIHFAVNCASASCPPLRGEPYAGETLDQQLDQATRDFIARQENVWMRGDALFLSAIFDWYKDDFRAGAGDAQQAVVEFVLRYLPEETAARVRREKPRVEFYDYNWALNDARNGN